MAHTILYTSYMHTNLIGVRPASDYTPFTPEKRVIPLHTEYLSARASDSAQGATK
jgi:hypothetical protein